MLDSSQFICCPMNYVENGAEWGLGLLFFGYYVMPRQMGTRAPLFGYNVMPIWQCFYVYYNLFKINCLKKKSKTDKMGRPVGCTGQKRPDGNRSMSVFRPKRIKNRSKQVRLDRCVGDDLIPWAAPVKMQITGECDCELVSGCHSSGLTELTSCARC